MKNNRNGSTMTNKNSFNFSSNVLNIIDLSVHSGVYIINGELLQKYIFFLFQLNILLIFRQTCVKNFQTVMKKLNLQT